MWEGRTACKEGERTLSLTLENPIGDQLAGTLEVVGPTAISDGVPKLSIAARASSSDGTWDAVVAGAVRDAIAPAGPRKFTFVQKEGQDALHMTYVGGSCWATDLHRVTASSPSRVPTTTASDGGAYFAGTSQQERCQGVVDWLKKLGVEYPDLDLRNTPVGKVYPKLVLLLADDDFVPLFGQPYDAMPAKTQLKVAENINDTCGTDPFYRNELTGYSLIWDVLHGSRAPAISALIRETRVVRHNIGTLEEQLAAIGSIDEASPIARSLNALVANNANKLWPSEKHKAKVFANEKLVALALVDVDRDFARIAALSDPNVKLKELVDVGQGRKEYQKYLDDQRKITVHERAAQEQASLLGKLLDGDLNAIEALPETDGSLAALESHATSVSDKLVGVDPSVSKSFTDRVEAKRKAILDAAVAARMARLDALQPDPGGLKASVAWIGDFKRVFGPYKARSHIRTS